MDAIGLIQSLVDQLQELPHRDEAKEDSLRRRGELIIRKVFGSSSKYLSDLAGISFYPLSVSYINLASNEPRYDASWGEGASEMINLLKTMKEDLELPESLGQYPNAKVDSLREAGDSGRTDPPISTRIFLVHGHDDEMRETIARALERLDLRVVILREQPNQGRTVIEKFSDYSDVGYAVVALSPDDMGYDRDAESSEARPRARQNVIFELGFFVGKLGRHKVFVLYRESDGFEMPSDYSGVLYMPYNPSGNWKFELVRELKAAGYNVDANLLV